MFQTKFLSTFPAIILAIVLSAFVAGCSDSDTDDETATSSDEAVVVYSGRDEDLVGDLYAQFTEESGIELDIRYGDTPELSATLREEGDNSPADVFWSQDAGGIALLSSQLGELPDDLLSMLDERYHAPDGTWVGITGRVRTMVYNTETLTATDLPDSVFALTDEEWNGRIGVAPNNASFQGFVTAMRLAEGDDATLEWLEGLVANDVRTYEKNGQIVDAVADGVIDAGLVNHYYLYEKLAERPEMPIANHYFAGDDPGSFVNISAMGVLENAPNRDDALELIEYLLTEGQEYFAAEAEAPEYPLVSGVEADLPDGMPATDELEGPTVDFATLGEELEATVALIAESGLATA